MTGHPGRDDVARPGDVASGIPRKPWLLAIPALAVVAVAAWFARSPDTPDLAAQQAAASEPASASGAAVAPPAASAPVVAAVVAAPVVATPAAASTPPVRSSAVASRAPGTARDLPGEQGVERGCLRPARVQDRGALQELEHLRAAAQAGRAVVADFQAQLRRAEVELISSP